MCCGYVAYEVICQQALMHICLNYQQSCGYAAYCSFHILSPEGVIWSSIFHTERHTGDDAVLMGYSDALRAHAISVLERYFSCKGQNQATIFWSAMRPYVIANSCSRAV